MVLEPGSRLGPYEILAPLGAGGMSEVYRGRDLRLGREVALKVLHEESAGRSRLRRFEQEARAAGALNHPNVLAVYDTGTHDGVPYIVSELLEGHTLRTRLENGALPGNRAVGYALQIARGLGAAHDKGIVHRDLKPDNVFVTEDGRVKILDFGLAKLKRPDSLARTEHAANEATESGVVLGTVGFMSPEQVRGEEVDERSDIFSFGAVLYEMLSGQRAFRRDTAAETMTAILKEDPPAITVGGRGVSPTLARVVERCLEKRAADRFRSAHDLALALEVASSGESGAAVVEARARSPLPRSPGRLTARRASLTTLALVGFAAVGACWAFLHAPEPTPGEASDSAEPVRITPFTSDGGTKLFPKLSPDGDKVAYQWGGPTGDNFDIYVKALGVGARALRLTHHPSYEGVATWSPDELQIAFLRRMDEGAGAIFVVPSLGGDERKLIDLVGPVWTAAGIWIPGLSWSPDGEWLALGEKATAGEPARIVRLSMATLEKQPLTTPPRDSGGDVEPSFSPDGTQLAFVRLGNPTAGNLDVWVQPVEGGEARRVTFDRYDECAKISWTPDGRELLFTAGASRGSQRILRVSLAGGRPQAIPGLGEGARNASVSGSRMVYQQWSLAGREDIWRVPGRGAASQERAPERLISSSGADLPGAYSPDGRKIAFGSNRYGAWDLFVSDSDGSNQVQLTNLPGLTGSPRWSPDGRRIVFDSREPEGTNLFVIDDVEAGVPRRLTRETSTDYLASWSHDGRWIYFSSDRSGRDEIWKIPAEGDGPAVQVTQGGGTAPRESWDGRDLYYFKAATTSSLPGGSVWRAPVGGGKETEVVQGMSWNDWTLSRSGLYYATHEGMAGSDTPPVYTIWFLDLASGEVSELFRREAEGPYSAAWLEVSPDEEWLLFGGNLKPPAARSELMLVANFR